VNKVLIGSLYDGTPRIDQLRCNDAADDTTRIAPKALFDRLSGHTMHHDSTQWRVTMHEYSAPAVGR